MKYKTRSLSLIKINFNSNSYVEPLCNSCMTHDCSHLIEEKEISILGNIKKMRLMIKSSTPSCVVGCEGYSI